MLLAGALAGPATATEPVSAPVAAPASVPSPTVTGPIPATARPGDPSHNYPFFATDQDLRAFGSVEEEYFIEGTAGGHHYKTRMVVRRPASPRKFNGTAIVEWYNVTNTFDYEVIWSRSWRHMLAAGYVWVGVSAQQSGVHSGRGLKAWNPNRYGTLDLTVGGTVTDDSLSYAVFSQAAQALLHPIGANPVPGLNVRTLIATGQSQSASRLTTYANEAHAAAPAAGSVAGLTGLLPTPAAHAAEKANRRGRLQDPNHTFSPHFPVGAPPAPTRETIFTIPPGRLLHPAVVILGAHRHPPGCTRPLHPQRPPGDRDRRHPTYRRPTLHRRHPLGRRLRRPLPGPGPLLITEWLEGHAESGSG